MSDHLANNKDFDRSHFQISTPKQIFQKLSRALEEVKADNTSENLLNEIRQISHSFQRAREISKTSKISGLIDYYSILPIKWT